MKKPMLHVFANGEHTGRLDRSDIEEDTFLFTYDQHCLPQQAVSLSMPIRADQYDSMSGLLPLFEMNLPEGALKERLRLQFAKAIPQFDDLDLLAIVGSSQIGRLRYAHTPQLLEAVPAQHLDEILAYQGSADLFAHLLERYATYSGISGMQPKVLVRDAAFTGSVPPKLAQQGATHIVKTFDPAEYPELAANEFICTQGAAAAGISTVRLQLSANRRLLLVDRFDLTTHGDYLGLEDFCVLDGRRAHGRYDGSYEGLARRIDDYVSPALLGEAREQYALMVAYACAIENGDAHLKNFSVLYASPDASDPAGEVSLAPAYDMVATSLYHATETLALTLGGSKQFPDHATLLRFIRQITGKSEKAARRLLEQVAVGVDEALVQAQGYAKQHADAQRFVEKFTGVLQRGLARISKG